VPLIAILVSVTVAYWPSLTIPYLFDDHTALEDNPYLQDPGSLGWVLRVPENSTLIARPFLSWTFGLNALLFGHDSSGYHVVNLLIHLANVFLVGVLTRRGLAFTQLREPTRSGVSLAVAFIWGMHPLNVQAVGYLIQRGESLATLLELMTLFAWIKSGEKGAGRWWLLIACACMLMAAGTKEHGWIAPLLPLLWAWVFLGRTPAQEIRRSPFFYSIGAGSWVLLGALTLTGGRLAHVGAESEIDTWTYFINQPEVLTHYVRLFLVPIGQSFDYDWEVSALGAAWPWLALWSALFVATAYTVWKRLPIGFPAALIFLSLSTSSSLIALPDLAFEHRYYLAGACTAALILAPLAHLARSVPLLFFAGAACVALTLGVVTYQRSTLFQSELAVWSEALEQNARHRRALSNIGGILLAEKRPQEALEYFRKVEAIGIPHRMQTRSYYMTGNALLDLGRIDEARAYYHKALKTVQGNPAPIYMNLGHAHMREGQFAEARAMFEQALLTLKGRANLYFDLAFVCTQLGDAEAAVVAYEQGIRLGGRPQPALKQLMTIFRPDLQ
jgi:tetratricopeptide (TPR) repeat protein